MMEEEEEGYLKDHFEEGQKLKKFKLNDDNDETNKEESTAEVDLNPFLLEPVLRILMKSMSIADLKATRLVSNFWAEMSLEQLKIKLQSTLLYKKVRLEAGFEYDRFYQELKHHHLVNKFDVDFSLYLKTIQANPAINIFEDFEIIDLALFHNHQGEIVLWKELFKHLQLTSRTLRKLLLSLYFDYNSTTDRKLDDMRALTPEFTQLKKLTFYQAGSNGDLIRHILSSILKKMPQLRCFITDEFPQNQQLVDIILDSTPGSTNGGPITKLEVNNWTNSNDEVIIFKSVQIQHLKVKILKINKSNTSLYTSLNDFLLCQSPLIESLKLDIEVYVESPAKITFPIFEQIKQLDLNEFHFTCVAIGSDIVAFNFAVNFPNLVELRVNKCDFLYGHRGSKTVKIFRITSYSCMKINFAQLGLMFPNIETLETNDCMLRDNGAEIPWGSTLEKLKLSLKTYQFMNTAQLGHLKKLRVLDIEYFYQVFLTSETNRQKKDPDYCQPFIQSFNSIIKLNLEIVHVCLKGFGLKKSEIPEFQEKAQDPVVQNFKNTRTKIIFSY